MPYALEPGPSTYQLEFAAFCTHTPLSGFGDRRCCLEGGGGGVGFGLDDCGRHGDEDGGDGAHICFGDSGGRR